MTYVVEWEQWYRCGKYGDDKECETRQMEFGTEDAANDFIADLIDGKHRGLGDLSVKQNEINLYNK